MMTNLFNIFDPSSSISCALNWLSSIIILIFLPYFYWFIPSRMILIWKFFINFFINEFKILINFSFSNLLIFLILFSFIFLNNFIGLFPYIFTASSHMSFCLTFSLTLWISMMIFGWINFFNLMFCHLVPQSTPIILMPFMVLIESISLIIRPLTLSIRLTANMIAGHLLLTLIGSSNLINDFFFFPLIFLSQFILMFLEIAVSLIQAYVFSILSTLYSSEI